MLQTSLWQAASANLFSPPVLCFFLGCIATFVRSDLKIPEPVYSLLTIYLLFALGLKGGAELSHTPLATFAKPALATLALGIVTPFLAFSAARFLGKQTIANAAALGAHYGSVSVVTFMSVLAFLDALHIPHEPYLSTLVVLLEAPAIVFSLLLAHIAGANPDKASEGDGEGGGLARALHEVLTGRSILLLLGGLAIGALSGTHGSQRVEPFFGAPFQGVVALFLLELGLVASRRVRDLRRFGWFVVAFGVCVPLVNSLFGLAFARAAGLDFGGTVVLATLAASASYIAAPAAVRIALPNANPSIYLTAALAVTFPFNLLFGIPIYFELSKRMRDLWP